MMTQENLKATARPHMMSALPILEVYLEEQN
jgi:hypothetical protein